VSPKKKKLRKSPGRLYHVIRRYGLDDIDKNELKKYFPTHKKKKKEVLNKYIWYKLSMKRKFNTKYHLGQV
jgi:hypothetical protein